MSIQQRFKNPVAASPCSNREDRMMIPKKAAAYIGVSVDIMYEMIHDRKIPYVVKPGNGKRVQYLLDCVDLDNWIERRKIKAVA
jgi:excisionase family DNA binding protein